MILMPLKFTSTFNLVFVYLIRFIYFIFLSLKCVKTPYLNLNSYSAKRRMEITTRQYHKIMVIYSYPFLLVINQFSPG